ncbi:hypothetical protein [Saccharothrix xinjiangensis]|uniref:Uncharacterized protein n=1 Tax=Saccharothrix xinjiangensis TaxID=204798 RepID=A0ABV9YGA3_9PSEU
MNIRRTIAGAALALAAAASLATTAEALTSQVRGADTEVVAQQRPADSRGSGSGGGSPW